MDGTWDVNNDSYYGGDVMAYIKDNYDLFRAHDTEKEAKVNSVPVCCVCEEPIMSEYCYELGNEIFCEACAKENIWEIEGDNFRLLTERVASDNGNT